MKSTKDGRNVEVFPECVKTATGYTEVMPKDIGYGRKPSDPSGEKMQPRQIRMTDALWAKCRRLGGGAWVRQRIARAADPDQPADDPEDEASPFCACDLVVTDDERAANRCACCGKSFN